MSKKRFVDMSINEIIRYYNDRKKAIEDSEKITYHDSGKEYSISSVNYDTLVRIVNGKAVPIAIADCR